MKEKTIKDTLKKVHENFCLSIEDEKVRMLVRNHSIIAGGAICSMLENQNVNDYDFYFNDQKVSLQVAEYFTKMCDSEVHKNDKSEIVLSAVNFGKVKHKGKPKKYTPLFLTDNAITLSGKIQLIFRFYGSPKNILKNFDFAHCFNYWESSTKEISFHPEALLSLLTKELKYKGSLFPVCSLFRLRKFINRGWTINAGEMLKICLQISQLNLMDREILRDQLIGVDTIYFVQLIKKLERKSKEGPIENWWLIKLINEIFN